MRSFQKNVNFVVGTLNTTESDGIVTWTTVMEQKEIYSLLVENNRNNIRMSNTIPFATGPIADAI